jgi:hypothetical protein
MAALAAQRALDDDVSTDQEGSQVAVGRPRVIFIAERRETANCGHWANLKTETLASGVVPIADVRSPSFAARGSIK